MTELADLFGLSGKRGLVTGARGGLGQAMALTLAKAAADIVGLGSTPMPETKELIEAAGRHFLGIQADLSQPNDFRALVGVIEEQVGPIDLLVNNAGTIRRADLLDYTEADWDVVTNVNEKSLFFPSRAIARGMVSRRFGRIVNVASLHSFQGGIRVPAYTASKHAVVGLTKLMANELAASGVTVNAIAPGYMETDNTAALRADPDRQRQILVHIPMGRWGGAGRSGDCSSVPGQSSRLLCDGSGHPGGWGMARPMSRLGQPWSVMKDGVPGCLGNVDPSGRASALSYGNMCRNLCRSTVRSVRWTFRDRSVVVDGVKLATQPAAKSRTSRSASAARRKGKAEISGQDERVKAAVTATPNRSVASG